MSDEQKIIDKLFSLHESEYGEDYKNKLFEQYRIFLQMIDNLTRRRTIANNFFLSVNTGLLAAFGLLVQLKTTSFEISDMWVLAGSIAGILFSYSWYRTVESYKQLSSVKWKIVLEIEKKLPLLLHDTEWKLLGEGNDKKKYKKLTDVERAIPIIFIAGYVAVIVLSVNGIVPKIWQIAFPN